LPRLWEEEDVAIAYLDAVRHRITSGRKALHLTRFQAELAGVKRALDITVLDPALGERRLCVSARVVQGPHTAVVVT
jgi:hypothetical protein